MRLVLILAVVAFTALAATPPKHDRADPGRVTARRLNRYEYNNTVRDLLAVDFQPAADFPADDSGYGFDNIGDVLSLSPVLMEKYLAAAEKIARIAIVPAPLPKPTVRAPRKRRQRPCTQAQRPDSRSPLSRRRRLRFCGCGCTAGPTPRT